MEIAVFGGTFDPPTLAHEAIIRACLERTDMDEVWVMPSGDRPDKPDMRDGEARLRLLHAVLQESFNEDPRLKVSDFEMRLPQPTQTYLTVRALRHAYPEGSFWYVFGADSYQDMPTWRGGSELRRTLGMLVVPRAGYELPEAGKLVRHLHIRDHGISSSQVRGRMQAGKSIQHLVSPGVQALL